MLTVCRIRVLEETSSLLKGISACESSTGGGSPACREVVSAAGMQLKMNAIERVQAKHRQGLQEGGRRGASRKRLEFGVGQGEEGGGVGGDYALTDGKQPSGEGNGSKNGNAAGNRTAAAGGGGLDFAWGVITCAAFVFAVIACANAGGGRIGKGAVAVLLAAVTSASAAPASRATGITPYSVSALGGWEGGRVGERGRKVVSVAGGEGAGGRLKVSGDLNSF